MNRNILTDGDIAELREAVIGTHREEIHREISDEKDRLLGGPVIAAGSVPVDTPDAWYERLVKYIPAEALSLYLGLDRGIRSSNLNRQSLITWLALALVLSVVFNGMYLRRIWKVQRVSQITVSCVALLAYVYVSGGVFEVANISPSQVQLLVLIVATAFLTLFEPPERYLPH